MNQSKHDTRAHPKSPHAAADVDANGSPLEGCGKGAEEVAYDPVPPRKTVTVSVRYRIRGRGRPLPYPLDSLARIMR